MLKRIISVIVVIILGFSVITKTKAADELSVSAKSAVLIEAESGKIVYSKNADQRLPMASTTKIMTGLIVLENAKLDHKFKVSSKAVGCEGTSAYLCEDDVLTIEAALYALLLQSANDAAVALAIEVGGSIDSFAQMMNKKAIELGLADTNFKNPSGLPAKDHYTTAKDLAIITSVALKNPDFSRIVATKSVNVKINEADRTFVNHNKLLSLYEGAIGVKTGFTKESGRCLVGAAQRDGVKLITVTLSASNDWADHKNMFDLGFKKLRSYCLFSGDSFIIEFPIAGTNSHILASPVGEKQITLPNSTRIAVRIERTSLLQLTAKAGDTVGYAVFYADGKELYRAPLCALKDPN